MLPQVRRHLQSCRIPLPIPKCCRCHPGDHSSSSVRPTVPRGCLPRGPAVAGPPLPLSCILCPGNTPFLPAGHTHCTRQLCKPGDGQVCFSAWRVEHLLQKPGGFRVNVFLKLHKQLYLLRLEGRGSLFTLGSLIASFRGLFSSIPSSPCYSREPIGIMAGAGNTLYPRVMYVGSWLLSGCWLGR